MWPPGESLKPTPIWKRPFLVSFWSGRFGSIYFRPKPAHLFVDHSVSILYFTLFLMTFLPQLFGYDPFTYAMAKLWSPPSVWETDDFRLINFHITYLWSGVFFACFLSSTWGQGKPLYAIFIPFALCLGIGLVFSRKYPEYYLRRKYRVNPAAAAEVPDSAVELIEGMPGVFDPAVAGDLQASIQFLISGDDGGQWVLSISEGKCEVRPGRIPAFPCCPVCLSSSGLEGNRRNKTEMIMIFLF